MRGQRGQFWAFVLTGAFAAVVNIAARVLFSLFMPFEIAILVAYLIAMITAYALSRQFVFQPSGRPIRDEIQKFALVNLVAIIQVWLVTVGLASYVLPAIGWNIFPKLVAHFVGVASPVLTSYLGHKHFSFRPLASDTTEEN